jgi:hypothetical protein
MLLSESMSATISFDTPNRLRRPGIAAGLAVSLLLHAVLIFGYRLSSPVTSVAPQQPARLMTVWLHTAPTLLPLPVPARREKTALAKAPAAARARVRSIPAPESTPPAVITQAPAPPAESQAISLPPPDPLYADQQPKKFDMNAALKTARKTANEKDPARANLPVAQLDSHPLYAEDHQTQLQRGVASAKKTDCLKEGAGAGLLAPLLWAMDKHCKF